MAILGDCEGGALKLADGRMFRKKRQWYQYNGALVEHGVMPFRGERLSVVLFQPSEATPVLALGGEVPRPLNTEAADPTLLHPKVPVYEDPAEQQRREQALKAAAEKRGMNGDRQLHKRHGIRLRLGLTFIVTPERP